jgi:hypothetical protein
VLVTLGKIVNKFRPSEASGNQDLPE